MSAPIREDLTLRVARPDEAAAVDALMKTATRDIFPLFYDAEQTASSVRFIASVDRTLIEDGTYFVVEVSGELVACGGWSRRDKLYSGSGDAAGDSRLLDPATEPLECAPCSRGPSGRGKVWAPASLKLVKAQPEPKDSSGFRSLPPCPG